MKNRIIAGSAAISGGALIALGPQTLFKICDQSHHAVTSICFWTGQAAIGIGAVLALLGGAYFFFRSPQIRAGLSLGIAANIILLVLTANVLIGMDEMPMMACRVSTLPALNVISAVDLVLASINTVYLLRKQNGGLPGRTQSSAAALV
jgi:hypothetical protein